MRHNYSLLAVGLALASVAPGCGTIIGLDDYEVVDEASSSSGGRNTGSGGSDNTGGDTSSAGTSSGGSDTGGNGTGGGSPNTCDDGCDDDNDCTTDACVEGECLNEPVDEGEACDGGYCNADADCVACLDDKSGYSTDTGCNSITPSCDTSTDVPVCKGCMVDADCNDLDDCTIDKCDAHWCVAPTSFLPAGSACGDPGHACNDSGKCSDCWDTSNGGVDAGCQAGAGSCDISGPEPICTGCTTASDCDDGNECTQQTCNGQGQCVLTPIAQGNGCSGGVCNGVQGNEACIACIDDDSGVTASDVDSGCENVAGKPYCTVTPSGPACQPCMNTIASAGPSDVDAGCTGSAPLCVADAGGILSCTRCANTQPDNGSALVDDGCSVSTPFCVGSGSARACRACVNDVSGTGVDSGCSAGAPMCDANGVCRQCLVNSDCASDGFSCTNEVCNSGVCSSPKDNTKCSNLDGNVCTRPTCEATSGTGPTGCVEVNISVITDLVTTSASSGNGGFEALDGDNDAVGWIEEGGAYDLSYTCGAAPSGNGCEGIVDDRTFASSGSNAMWLAGVNSNAADFYKLLLLPANTTRLEVIFDHNIQTVSTSASNADHLRIWFEDEERTHIGTALGSWNATNGQTSNAVWTKNVSVNTDGKGINVASYAGGYVIISFESITNATLITDFFVDNVRIRATVCAP